MQQNASDNQIRSVFESITRNINEDMDDCAPVKSLSAKLRQEPSHMVIAIVVVVLVLTAIGFFQHIFITLFGLLYPAYMSFKVNFVIFRRSIWSQRIDVRCG